eukprot:1918102-Amphidinium_carterae.1
MCAPLGAQSIYPMRCAQVYLQCRFRTVWQQLSRSESTGPVSTVPYQPCLGTIRSKCWPSGHQAICPQ